MTFYFIFYFCLTWFSNIPIVTSPRNEVTRKYTKYDIYCPMVFNITMITFWMTLMNKLTDVDMDDGSVCIEYTWTEWVEPMDCWRSKIKNSIKGVGSCNRDFHIFNKHVSLTCTCLWKFCKFINNCSDTTISFLSINNWWFFSPLPFDIL